MSYDICIHDKKTDEEIVFNSPHLLTGGTYALGGTNKAWLNITYNYHTNFKKAFKNEDGIHFIEGKTVKETLPLLEEGVNNLGDELPSHDYWEATDGNAKIALMQLVTLAKLALQDFPDKELIWRIF